MTLVPDVPLAPPAAGHGDRGGLPPRPEPPETLRLAQVTLLAGGGEPSGTAAPSDGVRPGPVGELDLVFDAGGIGVARPADTPRVLAWESVRSVAVGPPGEGLVSSEPAALIAVETSSSTYQFVVPGAGVEDLRRRIAGFVPRHATLAEVPTNAGRFERLRPYLAAAMVAFVALAVAVILAQSAGAIHWGFLGGNGGGPPG